MKAQVTLLFIFIFLSAQPTASTQVSSTVTQVSKIKTIETYKVNLSTGEKNHYSSEYFNDLGKLERKLVYKANYKKETHETFYSYDTITGKWLASNTKNPRGKEVYFFRNKYDEKGRVIEENAMNRTTKFMFDDNDNITIKEVYNEDGKFYKADKYELAYVENSSNLKSKITFQKRKKGEYSQYDEHTYFYNKDGKLEKETVQTRFYKYTYLYKYYPNGNRKEKTSLIGDTEKVVTHYNENGLRKEEAIFRRKDANSEMILEQKNIWDYDRHDNEILSESYNNDKMISKTIREITYW